MPADLLDILRGGAAPVQDLKVWQGGDGPPREAFGGPRAPVGPSPDLTRILALPRRAPPDLSGVEGAALVELAIRRWGRGKRACECRAMGRDYCIDRPFAIQAFAMHEASLIGGLAGPITVGGGKTFLDVMLAMAVPNVRQAVLLVPPKLREQVRAEYLAIAEHFHVPSMVDGPWNRYIPGRPVVHVVPYSIFSRPESTALLEQYKPDLIISDEAHKLRHLKTATSMRFLRYCLQNLPKFCWLTGTAVSSSLTDCTHLFAIALRDGSPLPLDPAVADNWAEAVDPSSFPAPPGRLEVFGLPVRSGLHRRIVETPGVVASSGASIETPLRVLEWRPAAAPEAVTDALDKLRKRMIRPDEQRLVDDLEVARTALELSCGFFYRWRFPRGESEDLINEWYAARKEWGQELREVVARGRVHLDSMHLATEAARRAWGDTPSVEGLPEWRAESWPRWRDVRDLVLPVTGDPVWIDDWLVREAASWASSRRGVVWYTYNTFGAKVAGELGLPLHTGGPGAYERLRAERGDRPAVVSMRAHGTGFDGLQFYFSECLLANPPSSGQTVEQVLGRLHRPGQRAAEVVGWVPRHTPEVAKAVGSAIQRSEFIDELMHPGQKLAGAGLTTADE